jgi:apolipoprotein N-acyltransferase
MPPPTALPRQVVPLVLALLMLLALQWTRRPRLRLAMATAMLTLIAIAGCSGSSHPTTPKGAATLTIKGTSGALTHSVQVQISIN